MDITFAGEAHDTEWKLLSGLIGFVVEMKGFVSVDGSLYPFKEDVMLEGLERNDDGDTLLVVRSYNEASGQAEGEQRTVGAKSIHVY